MPAARGLFHRAIVMSGAGIRLTDRERAAKLADAALGELGLEANPARRAADAAVPAVDRGDPPGAEEDRPSSFPLFDRYDFGPVVDGAVLPAQPFDPAATAISADIPVLVGGVKDEMAIYLAPEDRIWERNLTEDELRARIATLANGSTERVIETYRKLFPTATPADRLISILTDSNFRLRSITLAERKAAPAGRRCGSIRSTGRRRYSAAGSRPSTRSTCRSCSRPSMLSAGPTAAPSPTISRAGWPRPGRRSRAPEIPTIGAIPHWPAYTAAERATLVLDRDCHVDNDYGREARLLWKEITRVV